MAVHSSIRTMCLRKWSNMFSNFNSLVAKVENLSDTGRIVKAWAVWFVLSILSSLVAWLSFLLLNFQGLLLLKLILNGLGAGISAIHFVIEKASNLSFSIACGFTFIGGGLNIVWAIFMVIGKWLGKLDYNTVPEPPVVLDLLGAALSLIWAVQKFRNGLSPRTALSFTQKLQDRWFLAGTGGRIIMVLIGLVILAILIGLIIFGIKIFKSRKGGGPKIGNRIP